MNPFLGYLFARRCGMKRRTALRYSFSFGAKRNRRLLILTTEPIGSPKFEEARRARGP